MEEKVRVGISIEPHLLKRFDREIEKKKYWNRSEAVRDLIRDYLVEHEWKENRRVIGTITLLYDHHVRDLTRVLTRHQHQHHSRVLSTLHLHLDERYCLEVLVVKGTSKQVRELADLLIGTRGVLHGKLTATSLGKDL
jgi:CopG family nickel-responsive transcriptional regulator